VGVVHAGRIVAEQLLPPGRAISVGAHARSSILLPGEDQSERVELFVVRSGRLHLKLLPGARGKLSVDGAVRTLDSLALDGATVRRGGELLYPLADDARGKVQFRDYTLLFQLVEPPPQAASSGGGLTWSWRDVDWIFMGLVAISALMHAAAVAWIESQPPPTRVELRELVHRHVAFAMPAPEADVSPEPPTEDAPEASENPTIDDGPPVPTPAAEDPEPGPEPSSPEPGETEVAAEPFEGTFIELIGNALDDPNSSVRGLIDDGSDYDDIGEALAQGEVRIARDRERPGLRGPTEIGDDVASIGVLGPAGDCPDCPARPTRRPDREPVSQPDFVADPLPVPKTGDFDIRPWLKRLHPKFKACYETELKLNPDLTGRVTLSFATNGSAQVVDASIDSNTTRNAALGQCVTKWLNRLSLPPEAANLDVEDYSLMFAPQ